MAFGITYKTLFTLVFYHSYFLNDGADAFSDLDGDQKKKQLKSYKFQDFLNVFPTVATQKVLKDYKITFKNGTDRITVLNKVIEKDDKYKSSITLKDDVTLTFLLYAKDYLFSNYTSLPFEQNRLYYFTNTKPSSEETPYDYIPLNSSSDLVTEDFLLSEESSRNIWYTIIQENSVADNAPFLELLADVSLKELDSEEGQSIVDQSIEKERNKGLIGIVRLSMKGDETDLVEIDDDDPEDVSSYLLEDPLSFKLHFNNRKTIWKYIKRSDNQELLTSSVQPLTKNGFIKIDPDTDIDGPLPDDIEKYTFPNPTADRITSSTDEDTEITTTYSEIFI